LFQFYALLLYNVPALLDGCTTLTPEQHLHLLSCKLQLCLARHPVLTFRPSTLALAVLSLELEMFRPDWLSITLILQRMAHVSLVRMYDSVYWHKSQPLKRFNNI